MSDTDACLQLPRCNSEPECLPSSLELDFMLDSMDEWETPGRQSAPPILQHSTDSLQMFSLPREPCSNISTEPYHERGMSALGSSRPDFYCNMDVQPTSLPPLKPIMHIQSQDFDTHAYASLSLPALEEVRAREGSIQFDVEGMPAQASKYPTTNQMIHDYATAQQAELINDVHSMPAPIDPGFNPPFKVARVTHPVEPPSVSRAVHKHITMSNTLLPTVPAQSDTAPNPKLCSQAPSFIHASNTMSMIGAGAASMQQHATRSTTTQQNSRSYSVPIQEAGPVHNTSLEARQAQPVASKANRPDPRVRKGSSGSDVYRGTSGQSSCRSESGSHRTTSSLVEAVHNAISSRSSMCGDGFRTGKGACVNPVFEAQQTRPGNVSGGRRRFSAPTTVPGAWNSLKRARPDEECHIVTSEMPCAPASHETLRSWSNAQLESPSVGEGLRQKAVRMGLGSQRKRCAVIASYPLLNHDFT